LILSPVIRIDTYEPIIARTVGCLGYSIVSLESYYLLTPSRFAGYPLTRAYHSEGIDRALSGQNGAGSYNNYRNPATPVMGVYRWVPQVQAALLAETTTAEVLAAADQAQWISAMLMLGVCLIALLIGLLIATRLARPIVALPRVAAGISAGDLDQRAEIRQRNEIGVLAAGFNSMTASPGGLWSPHTKALNPVIARPTISVLISRVPS